MTAPLPPNFFELERNDLVRIRIARTKYRDHEFVDIRIYVQNDAGEFVPTKKGITLSPEQLPKFISGLQSIQPNGVE